MFSFVAWMKGLESTAALVRLKIQRIITPLQRNSFEFDLQYAALFYYFSSSNSFYHFHRNGSVTWFHSFDRYSTQDISLPWRMHWESFKWLTRKTKYDIKCFIRIGWKEKEKTKSNIPFFVLCAHSVLIR